FLNPVVQLLLELNSGTLFLCCWSPPHPVLTISLTMFSHMVALSWFRSKKRNSELPTSQEMSRRNVSKSDREIIAQGSNKDDFDSISGEGGVGTIEDLKRRDSTGSTCALPPSPKGKEAVRFKEERNVEAPDADSGADEATDTKLKELEEACRNDWWEFAENNARKFSQRTILRWNELSFKPHRDLHLEGQKDWGAYRNDVMYALQSIGYTPGLKLFELDKLKFGSMIRRTVKDGPRGIIEDISDGELMMRRLGQAYRQTGTIQGETFFSQLLEMKYSGDNPIDYVTNFRRAVRDVRSTKLELQDAIVIILFKLSVKDKAESWYHDVSQAARKITWTPEE
ncbi:hypothetical protein GcM1_102002, partial [Golovinomyces cichoracearum]